MAARSPFGAALAFGAVQTEARPMVDSTDGNQPVSGDLPMPSPFTRRFVVEIAVTELTRTDAASSKVAREAPMSGKTEPSEGSMAGILEKRDVAAGTESGGDVSGASEHLNAIEETRRELRDFANSYIVEGGLVYSRAELKAQAERDRAHVEAFEAKLQELTGDKV